MMTSLQRGLGWLLLSMVAIACTPPLPAGGREARRSSATEDEPDTPKAPTKRGITGEGETPGADECVAPAGARQKDVDPEDSPETPFRRTPGRKVVVFFENDGASDRYWDMLVTAAGIWSKSPCIDARPVDACPPDANCVRLEQARRSPDDDDTDGEFSGDDDGEFRTGGTITVFTELMDEASDNGALATIVHEVGHALGLVHRLDEDDVMNAETDDDTDPIPDPIDFDNLLAIYGSQR